MDGMIDSSTRCPCGSGDSYGSCCEPLHSGAAPAASATALMRSRFTAFAVGDGPYLIETWHPSTRPDDLELDDRLRWTRLDIVEAVDGGPFDATGIVEFRAHYRGADTRGVLHERSQFVRDGGRWLYVSGDVTP